MHFARDFLILYDVFSLKFATASRIEEEPLSSLGSRLSAAQLRLTERSDHFTDCVRVAFTMWLAP
eukprot:4885882-Pyramimonas_sp.AAC.1